MVVECDRVVELIDGEAVLVEAWDVRLEPLAAGSQHQAVVGQRAPHPVRPDDHGRLAGGVDDVDPALFVSDVEGLEQFPKRCHHGLGRALVEAGTDHQPRLRRDDDDLESVGRDALLVAQARGAQGRIHAGKAGTDDQDALHGCASG